MNRSTSMADYRFKSLLTFLTVLFGAIAVKSECMNEGSGSGGGVLMNATNARCIAVKYAKENSLIFDTCLQYIQTEKNFIYNYGINFEDLKSDLSVLDATLDLSTSSPYCMDLIRAYTCNYVYPGCNNATGLPQGICKEECERYVLADLCKDEFNSLVTTTESPGRPTFTRQCDNTLLFLQDFGINRSDFDACDCYNITDTLGNQLLTTSTESLSTTERRMEDGASKFDLLLIIAIASSCLVALSCLSMTIIIVCSWRARKARKKLRHILESTSGQTLPNNYQLQLIESNHHDYDDIAPDLFQLSEEDVHAFGRNAKLREVLVPFENLRITEELNEGAFGRVFKGFLQKEKYAENKETKTLQVAIKTIKNTQGMYRELKAFIEESVLMCSFDHPHVLGMVGICLDTVQSPYLLLPFMENGDLRTFLRNKRDTSRSSDTGYPEGLDYELLVRMCYEIATGMEYLASKKLVHRDLAARNCMVDQDLTIKVADFGLARMIYHTDYYRQHQQTKVPVKWMAPESLHDMISTEKSDVWSYGVVCWEVFSLGRLPYPTLANHEVVDYLERGNRLKKPALCSDIIHDLLQRCWEYEYEKRPTFSEIVSQFHLEGLVSETFRISWVEKRDYALLGPETEMEDQHQGLGQEEETQSPSDGDTDSLLNAILTHFQKTPPASFVLDTLLSPSNRRGSQPAVVKPDLEYYIDMTSKPHDIEANVFVNQSMHEYDVISINEEDEGQKKPSDHVTSSPDHVTGADDYDNGDDVLHKPKDINSVFPTSDSDYILMHSAEFSIL